MKRLLSVILVLTLLMLPVQAGAASTFQFTRENFPRMDGSTSLVPLGTGITSVLLGLDILAMRSSRLPPRRWCLWSMKTIRWTI